MNTPRGRATHESIRSIDARHIHWAAVGFFGGFAVVIALGWLLWRLSFPVPNGGIVAIPPQPRLQPHPTLDLAVERGRETARLDGYAWVDRSAGIARIPIARAMQILAGKSAASAPTPAPATSAGAQR